MCACPCKKVDVTSRAVLDIMTKTTEYLQPNPASRAKLSMINTMSKIRGQEKGPGYPQAESVLGDAMLKFGRELGEESCFGKESRLSQPRTILTLILRIIRILCLSSESSSSSSLSSPSSFLTSPWFSPHLGLALIDAGEAMKELGEVKDALDMEVKQNFIDPLQNLHDKDLKEIQVSVTR